ncbi:hypothetical protein CHU95_03665 [Niveispirillum lacus]|uniref:ATP synthase subunit b n=1 Tax=Niveispirillum lacus TaxID=1981099 RepID=A0A255Z5G4_9PROT|nr:ATP synthase F0 subunit B [Niveispirillum lacus]OYQ36671.1 hypothetical protein CHU95_03665 [Niveispirillum lacus]
MHLDPTTLALQLVNFLVLVLLLRRFLFRPVLAAIDRREAAQTTRQRDAEGMLAEAQSARDAIAADRAALAADAAALRAQARDLAEAERRRILDAARQSADGLRQAATDRINAERRQAEAELAEQAGTLALTMARRLLVDTWPDRADAVFAAALISELTDMEPAQKATLLGTNERITVTIARPWPEQRRLALQSVLPSDPVEWVVDPDLIAGVELSGRHHLIDLSWRAALTSAQEGLRE